MPASWRHCLIVMWDLTPPGEKPPGGSLKLFAWGLGIATLVVLVAFISVNSNRNGIPRPNAHLLFGIFITFVLAGFFFPRQVENAMDWLPDQTYFRFFRPKKDEKDSK